MEHVVILSSTDHTGEEYPTVLGETSLQHQWNNVPNVSRVCVQLQEGDLEAV